MVIRHVRSEVCVPRTCHGTRDFDWSPLQTHSYTTKGFKPEAPERLQELRWPTLPGRVTPPSSRGFQREGPKDAKNLSHRLMDVFDMPQEEVIGTDCGEKLYNAVRRSNTRKFMNLLMKEDTDVNWVHVSTGWTCLHLAAYMNDVAIVRALCKDDRVDVNRPANVRDTPLHIAAKCGRVESVKAILESPRADPTRRNAYGKTAMDFAMAKGQTQIARMIEKRIERDHEERLALATERAEAEKARADELAKSVSKLTSKDSKAACCGIEIPRKLPEDLEALEEAFANALKLTGILGNQLRAAVKEKDPQKFK